MGKLLKFRCQAKTEAGYRTITVDAAERIYHCNCQGTPFGSKHAFCAHIDATLVAGERHMVPAEDHQIADQAMEVIAKSVVIPDGWVGAWRRNRVWRGLAVPRGPRDASEKTNLYGDDYNERPRVCFTGKGHKPRSELMEEARGSGWQVEDSYSRNVKLLVAEDIAGKSSKLQKAASQNVPVVTYSEWEEMLAEGWIITPA